MKTPQWQRALNLLDPHLTRCDGHFPDNARWAVAEILSLLEAGKTWDEAWQPTVEWLNGMRWRKPGAAQHWSNTFATVVRSCRPTPTAPASQPGPDAS